MQCFPNCVRNSRSGNTNRKILLTTTESFLHMNSVPAFLEIYDSGLVSTPLRPFYGRGQFHKSPGLPRQVPPVRGAENFWGEER